MSLKRFVTWVIKAEPLLLALAVPVLVLPASYVWLAQRGLNAYDALGDPALAWPSRLSYLALALIALPWLARWARDGALLRRTPLDLPIVLFLLAMVLGLWPSVDRSHSLTMLLGIVAGIALCYGAWHWGNRSPAQRIWPLVTLLVLGGAALAALGFLQTDWQEAQQRGGAFLAPLHAQLSVLPALGAKRLNPSVLGNTLILVIPLAAAGLVAARRSLSRLGLAAALLLMLGYVVTVWSRGDLLALALTAVLALILWLRRGREVLVGLGAGVVGALVIALLLYPAALSTLADLAARIYPSRAMVWTRALYIIGDHPFTGAGLDDFRPIARNSYPYFNIAFDQSEHAHSWPLQAGVDGGVLGLLAVLGLAAQFYVTAETPYGGPGIWQKPWRNPNDAGTIRGFTTEQAQGSSMEYAVGSRAWDHRPADSLLPTSYSLLRTGFLAGFTAFFIGSLYDNGTMSAPRGALFFWLFLGAAMVALRWAARGPESPPPPLRRGEKGRQVALGVLCLVLGGVLIWAGWPWAQALWHNNLASVARNQGLYTVTMSDAERAGKATQAVEGYQRALSAAPELAGAHRNLGVLYWQAARPAESAQSISWTTALPLAPAAFFGGVPRPEDGFAAATARELGVTLALAPGDAVAQGLLRIAN